jgi:uncharacterized OB-fold protein
MSAVSQGLADWTVGGHGIVYQRCTNCSHVWYFRREFCPDCGATECATQASSGQGRVHAATLVHRAPSDEFRALAPYLVVLVDLDEGFRMMAHGDSSLAIGDRVACSFRPLGDRLLPFFEKVSS